MRTTLQVLIIGIQNGAILSLVGLGIALVYKATRILNFAQGEMGTVPAFAAYLVMTGFAVAGEPVVSKGRLWLATIVAIIVGALVGILINTLVIRRLAAVSPVTSLVATAAVFLLFTSIEVNRFEAKLRRFPRFVEGGFRMPGVNITVEWHTLVVLLVLGGAAALLALFFQTPPGVALLATAQEPFAAELHGVPVARMRSMAWAAAGVLAAVAGILAAGKFNNLSPGLVTTTFLIPAFTGAVLGGLTSMVGAVAGGLILGITVAAANQINTSFSLGIPGAPTLATFAVLLLVLLFRPSGLFGQEA
ncbi:MAG: branched-chain amino acid ABC transporter permease [Actinobacteria bacterium]|nr:branched-chain amino acid ABC transporter permease [Actinomycetota bacterium]MBV8957176.1 branched-chain amino acid ABC transporter permease [Actinomycetota bacterium]MBV9253904.1 branched-chain amino acid ABC transporter permease [Actinomycetota bacterium]MBV9662727.1 branched-chain amino acid ABC transporter permease [Actinomycetota bacterium]MBV9936223.1 branched-chain amino acid ABC transporter permease [Actinomycetota bacterium]